MVQGKASVRLSARRGDDAKLPYTTHQKVFNNLNDIFGDPDKRRNHRRLYAKLTQGSQRFIDFFSDYKRLGTVLGYPEQQLIDDLEERIYPNLQIYWSAQRNTLTSLKEIKNFLHRIDNIFREQRNTQLFRRSEKNKSSNNNPRKTTSSRAY